MFPSMNFLRSASLPAATSLSKTLLPPPPPPLPSLTPVIGPPLPS